MIVRAHPKTVLYSFRMEADDLLARIKAAAKDKRITQARLAEVAGITSQSAISNLFKGKRKLTIVESVKLKAFLELDEGEPIQWVPLIGLASAGQWNDATQLAARNLPMPAGVAGKRAFAVEIKGDSMDKLLPEGGWAVVDPDQRRLFAGKVYLIANDEHETTIKRYVGEPARFEPVSHNPMHEPFELQDQRHAVIGRIVSYGNTAGL